jgi:hypothetical protein
VPASKLQLAKPRITTFFDGAEQRIFSRKDLSAILSQHRADWRLAYSTTVNEFIDFLIQNAKLKEATLQSKTYSLPARYSWGDASPYSLALSLRRAATCLMLQPCSCTLSPSKSQKLSTSTSSKAQNPARVALARNPSTVPLPTDNARPTTFFNTATSRLQFSAVSKQDAWAP